MNPKVKISCRHLWKVFGPDPAGFVQNASAQEAFRDAKHIAAVRDVSFDVNEGEILIIMGLSGSGKSTLIRAITRLNDPTAGQVLFDGKDLLKATAAELTDIRRHQMGMVFQNFGLLPHRTAIANVAFPLEIRGVGREEREARAREMIKLVGLEGREDYFPRELSGGQQQRVGIARSLAVGPDIWFLDEPFSALDPLIRREMQDEFLRLQKMLKKTIVFITHDFEEAIRLGDRIGIMRDGQLVQLATPEVMVSSPANDYVREFTRNAPRDRVLTVGSIASSKPVPLNGVNILASAKIGEAAAIVLASDKPIAVVDSNGASIGAIDRKAMIQALYPQEVK